jgi:hypothetical protein
MKERVPLLRSGCLGLMEARGMLVDDGGMVDV